MRTNGPPPSVSAQASPEALRSVAAAEARLEALDRERRRTMASLERLRAQESSSAPRSPDSDATALGPEQKLALFRRLFRGREEIYPRLWVNERAGRKGYAPACANEWVRGVCEKPRIRCGECPNRAFLPVTDDVVLGHLRGRHVIGVYAPG